MTLEEFQKTLLDDNPPNLAALLVALWNTATNRWDAAHEIAQSIETPDAAWIHAHLHRREGDISNARYWYRRANQPEAHDSLEAEWARIAEALLGA